MNLIKHNFGSYRGYLTHLQACLAASLGFYAQAASIDWSRVSRLVFVCKGNVCRSPYAEARAASLGFPAISCGLDTSGGVPANPTAQRVARARNLELSGHRSLLFHAGLLVPGDLILAFEPDHYTQLVRLAAGRNAQISLLGIWANDDARPYMADPYGKSEQYFDRCFQIVDDGVNVMVNMIKQQATTSS